MRFRLKHHACLLAALLLVSTGAQADGPDAKDKLLSVRRNWSAKDARTRGSATARAELTIELVNLGSDAVPHIVKLLRTDGGGLPFEPIVNSLGMIGDRAATPALLWAFGVSNNKYRRALLTPLAGLNDPEVIPDLTTSLAGDLTLASGARRLMIRLATDHGRMRLLILALDEMADSADEKLTLRIVTALRFTKSPIAEAPLVRLLQSDSARVRLQAVQALGVVGGTNRAPEKLVRLLRSGEDRLRCQAARSLGKLNDARAIDGLIQALESKHPNLRSQAHKALQKLTGTKIRSNADEWRSWWDRQQAEAGKSYRKLVKRIADERTSTDTIIDSMTGLSRLYILREDVVNEMMHLLDHPDIRVQSMACRILSRVDSSGVSLRSLVDKLDGDEAVARMAWTSLKDMTGQSMKLDYRVWRQWVRER